MKTTEQTPATNESTTPELDKMLANKEQSLAIGEFLDWLQSEKKIVLCNNEPNSINFFDEGFEKIITSMGGPDSTKGKEVMYNNPERWERTGGLRIWHNNIETILAEYFGVDLNKAEKEKQSLLEGLRKR